MCNCIDKVRNEILQEDGVKFVRISLSSIREFTSGIPTSGNKTGQEIIIGKEVTKKDGTKKTKEEKTFLSHDFCPWCGIKYE